MLPLSIVGHNKNSSGSGDNKLDSGHSMHLETVPASQNNTCLIRNCISIVVGQYIHPRHAAMFREIEFGGAL